MGPAVVEEPDIKLCESPGPDEENPHKGLVISWVLMSQRRPLYLCVAGTGPNDLPQSDQELAA